MDRVENADDNERILSLLKGRLALGYKKYGHGVRIHEDTKEAYGMPTNDWLHMGLEELLDGIIYMTAAILRLQDKMEKDKLKKISSF